MIRCLPQGFNPMTFFAPEELVPDYTRTFRCSFFSLTPSPSPLSFLSKLSHPVAILCANALVSGSHLDSYIAQDSVHGKTSEEAFVEILVRSPEYWSVIRKNEPPKPAQLVELEILQGTSLVSLVNATDDFDTLEQLTFRLTGLPEHGQLKMKDRAFEYTPDDGFWGVDSFEFEVQDGMQLKSVGVVTINVMHINSAPQPICENPESGLLGEGPLLSSLRALTSHLSSSLVSLEETAALVRQTATEARLEDPQMVFLRTAALHQMSENTEFGAIIHDAGNTSAAHSVACSLSGTWEMDMVSADLPGRLNLSLMAFDRDEEEETTYQVLQAPERGLLLATTALPGLWNTNQVRLSYEIDCPCSGVLIVNGIFIEIRFYMLQTMNRTYLEVAGSFYEVWCYYVCTVLSYFSRAWSVD